MTTVHALDSARQPYTLELAAHHFHVVALRSTDHMQQTCFAEPADRTHTELSQPCRARTDGSSGSPSCAAASAYRLARTMMRSMQPRRTQLAVSVGTDGPRPEVAITVGARRRCNSRAVRTLQDV